MSLIDKMANIESKFRETEFFSPYTSMSKFSIVKMEGVNYEFRIVGYQGSGLGVFKPIDHSCAKFIRPASPEQSRSYFDVLPKVNLILCYECEYGWVAYPMNLESSIKSIGLDSEIVVRNVSDCERFDCIVGRWDGLHFWFDDVFPGSNHVKSEAMRQCFDPNKTVAKMKECSNGIKGITPEELKSFELSLASWVLFQKVSTEDMICKTLALGGGKLGKYVLRGENIEIRWTSPSGNEYISVVKKDGLDVVSAGICLSGKDEKFHLKDLPFVISEGENKRLVYRTRQIDMD